MSKLLFLVVSNITNWITGLNCNNGLTLREWTTYTITYWQVETVTKAVLEFAVGVAIAIVISKLVFKHLDKIEESVKEEA